MSAELQRKLHDMLVRMSEYGPDDSYTDGYADGLAVAIHAIVREDGANHTGCKTFDRDAKEES